MRDHAEVVVVGAGIMGLSIAYHLARRGMTDVIVLDKSYLCGGASGRNGGGVRAQWSSEANVRLMQESIRMCRDFATEMKINVWLRQGGYLFLARDAGRVRRALEKSVELQNECGLGDAHAHAERGARDRAGARRPTASQAASYNPDDGVVFPWPFVWGFAQAARKLGVEVVTFRDVVGFETTRRAHRRGRASRRMRPARRAAASALEQHPDPPRRQRRRRVVARDRADARRRAPEQAAPPRDLLDRAAQAVAQAARRRPRRTASTSASRRAARSSAASAQKRVARGPRPASSSFALPRPLRALARARVPRPRRREGAAPVGRLLRPHARREPHRRRGRRGRGLLPGERLHGPRLHDGARDRQAHGASIAESPAAAARRARWRSRARSSNAGTSGASKRASSCPRR